MSRRKDNKGRILWTGESQRKDLIYQYRYTDALGNRKCIYASDLKILREKEDELQRSLEDGLDYAGGEITVYEQLKQLTRKERTHRLCTRGGMLESFLQEPERLTDDDVMLLLKLIFHRQDTQELLKKLLEREKPETP